MKLGIFTILISLCSLSLMSQKSVVVDINFVLESMESYKSAQNQLDQIASSWRQDIAEEYDKIKSMYNKYQTEQVLLSDEKRKQRESEIMEAESVVRELQKEKFGPDGALFKKRQEMVQPIQDRVYKSIQEYADSRKIDLVFDSTGAIIFASPEFDKTDDIVKKLK